LRDVAAVVQRGEMVNRIAEEIETMIIELGVDARLLRLQLDEIYGDIDNELELVIADYLPPGRGASVTINEMARLSDDEVLDLRSAAAALHREGDPSDLDQDVAPKGLRLLNRVHKLSDDSATRIADHFGGLARLQRATVPDLMEVEGVDDLTAVSIKETLQRVTESAILDQYS
jgi:diadenylate cyclase